MSMPVPTSTGGSGARQLVDRIIYLASLASRREDIEPMMDTLRRVTSNWNEQQGPSQKDEQDLVLLEAGIKHYLATQDPIRSFTLESLEKRLQENQGGQKVSNPQRSLLIVVALSILAGGAAFLMPSATLTTEYRMLIAVPLFFVVLHVGIAWFYLSALRNFNREVRKAFLYICAGIVLLSIAFSHYVVITPLGLDSNPLFRYGGITWLFSIPFMLIFLGLRIYARLLQVKTMLLSPWLALSITAAGVGLLVLLPHGEVPNEAYFRLWSTGAAMIPLFALLGSILARGIKNAATPAYAKPMRWVYYYTLVVGLGSLVAVGALFYLGELSGAALALVTAGCGVVPQLVLLYTGYLFKKETGK